MTMKQTLAYRASSRLALRSIEAAVKRGANPAWFNYRVIHTEPVAAFCQRRSGDARVRVQRVHARETFANALPRNIADRAQLPSERGWWHYSFRDVPARESSETLLATLPNCRVVPRIDSRGEFWVTILTDENTSLRIREMALRPQHTDVLRTASSVRIPEAVWLLERVYDNYSHWFTAHMPKLLQLRELGLADQIVLPERRPRFIDDSLRHFGFEPEQLRTFDPTRILEVESLTVLETDRFRPGLLRRVRDESEQLAERDGAHRRVFVSRMQATRRRLLNESELWPLLKARGFERVCMEQLSFRQQVLLMQETAILCAPHGAGLTNMLFCPRGTHVIEMADLSFPNPNFYAVASAMELQYWLVASDGVGEVHPLEKDLRADAKTLMHVVDQAIGSVAAS